MSGTVDERSVTLNVVWTGEVFRYLRYFVASQMAHSAARFRFVVNGCPPGEVEAMEAFAAKHPEREVDVVVVSEDEMVAHGVALDAVRRQVDDGEWFCFIDPDIKANGSFLSPLFEVLGDSHVAVTSGKEVWTDDNVVRSGDIGVGGRHFFDERGFVFGSPHLAIYRRRELDETTRRWRIGLGSAGPDLSEAARSRLEQMGHRYVVYDTGKIVNCFLQADGMGVAHRDLPQLVHIGGLSHFLAPPGRERDTPDAEPQWAKWESTRERYIVARHTAETFRHLCDGAPRPAIPPGAPESTAAKCDLVEREVDDLVDRYEAWV